MVGAGDGDGVNVFVFEQFFVVFVTGGGAAGFGGGEVEVVVTEVADGDGLGIGVFQESVMDLIAAIAKADEPHLNAAIGGEDPGIAEGGGGFRDLAAGHVMLL